MAKDKSATQTNILEINLNCKSVVGFYHLQNRISPIKRLYVKNVSDVDRENVTVRVYSKPEFVLPVTIEQALLPRKATVRFDEAVQLSPLFMVSSDERIEGEIFVQVVEEGRVLAEAKSSIIVTAFAECDYSDSPESIATFVRRTKEINKLSADVHKKLEQWSVDRKTLGYGGSKNAARNYFAGVYSVLYDLGFLDNGGKDGSEMISPHKAMLDTRIASRLEMALLAASLIEANDMNPVVGYAGKEWYVGLFLADECFSDVVTDDVTQVTKKMEKGVSDLSVVGLADVLSGVSFEKAEKKALDTLKKVNDIDFFIDVKRARILHIMPLPERERTESGYDLTESEDYTAATAPKQLREFRGDISGDNTVSRERQWERRLLDMNMMNALLNFRISQTGVKIMTADVAELVDNLTENKIYTVAGKPTDGVDALKKLSNGFDKGGYMKPVRDFVSYEYKNKRLRAALGGKEFDRQILNLYRKEKSSQEESGTSTLYLALSFLRWQSADGAEEDKYAPLVIIPATIIKRGISAPVYTVEINMEDAQINCTVLEFLFQEFNLDMRGLQNVPLSDPKNIVSVINRIKKEIVDRQGWEVIDNVYLCTLSFTNYLMWHDVKYKTELFRKNKIINSLILNRLDFDTEAAQMVDRSSDEAYGAEVDRVYLPISADSSQFSAIVDSLSKSFVLHGPPGTGKSQTITNIIANNIVRGRRVLFVAEKMAALSVVRKRLQDIGIGDFCLELHSDKTNKTDVLNQIISTLKLVDDARDVDSSQKLADIAVSMKKLQSEIDAMHKKRYLGFSLYDSVLNYFANENAPDCLRIDSLFYEKLTETSLNKYLELLTELALRAKECGDIDKSPFKHVAKFDYTKEWRQSGDASIEIYLLELKQLKQYARSLVPQFNIRTVALTAEKLKAFYDICRVLRDDRAVAEYFVNYRNVDNARGLVLSYRDAVKRSEVMHIEYVEKYGRYPDKVDVPALEKALEKKNYGFFVKRYFPAGLEKEDRAEFVEFLLKCEKNAETVARRTAEIVELCGLKNSDAETLDYVTGDLVTLFQAAEALYADGDLSVFNECCRALTQYGPVAYFDYYCKTYESTMRAEDEFTHIFHLNRIKKNEDVNQTIDFVQSIEKNMDFIGSWCKYQEIVEKCRSNGFEFVLEPLNVGEITANDILRCFKKCVYQNFIRSELSLDDVLCQFSGLTLEEVANRFKNLTDEYEKLTRQELFSLLCKRLPRTDTVGEVNVERVTLVRAEKNNMKGTTIRNLFKDIPAILAATCPCMLMSPTSVTQFLDIDMDKFDLVVFDEASQVPTCKALGSIVRGKNVVIVGDPKQLPPTTFFSNGYKDEEHYELEDLESILDDCLALGMPERHLLWHYRSNHESLIAFSNAMFYDNTLLTFPSPNELNSKVSFQYVDGVYERGGAKCNKKEADIVIKEIVARLQNPNTRGQSLGVVTFNTAQQNYIEDRLTKEVAALNLQNCAYEVDEPLFVKNLENVQGDERDVILFSVGFGPDDRGKLSLNFGPINQQGGYKRLNVAVTRARMEMKVFSAITGSMIDLNRTDSKGVKALKAFLEYAERGKEMLAIDNKNVTAKKVDSIGALIAKGLKDRGLLCEYDVGVSDFKIDVAVVDPRNKDKYILAIIADGDNATRLRGVRDRVTMETKILRKLGWNTYFLWTVNYFNNPKREIAKIKDLITTLAEKKVISKKVVKDAQSKYRRLYKAYYAKPMAKAGAEYVLNFVNEEAICNRIRTIIEAESPIEEQLLLERLCSIYNVPKTNKRAVAQLMTYMADFGAFRQEIFGNVFYADKPVTFFRPCDTKIQRDVAKIHPDEISAALRCAIECSLSFKREDAVKEILLLLNTNKKTKAAVQWIEDCIDYAIQQGKIVVTIDDVLTV